MSGALDFKTAARSGGLSHAGLQFNLRIRTQQTVENSSFVWNAIGLT